MEKNLPQVEAAPRDVSAPRLETSQLRIVQAQPSDADSIAEIAALVNIHNYAQFDRGFLFYSLTPEEYRKRIEDGHRLYLLNHRDQSIGFVCGVRGTSIEKILSQEFVYNELYSRAARIARERGISQYLFLDQVAVLPEWQNKGYGEALSILFLEAENGSAIFADFLEAPLRNPRIPYWCRRGFQKITELVEHPSDRFLAAESALELDPGSFETLTWGIYLLPAGGFTPIRVNPKSFPNAS